MGAARRGQQRLKLLYMAQIGERPPRFAIQVNSRGGVTRDYAYYLENRMRDRYALEGIPLIIDFVERGQRGRARAAADRFSAPAPPRDTLARRSLEPNDPASDNEFLFTSESVTEGHPDKIADQISDGVLDAVLADEPYGRVACETLVEHRAVVVVGRDHDDDLRGHSGDRTRDDPRDRLRRCGFGFTATPVR